MPLPVIDVAQMREWESATWRAGKSETAVIRTVGKAVAKRVLEISKEGDSILVLAGKGHNGDDARAAIKHLRLRNVTLLNITGSVQSYSRSAQKAFCQTSVGRRRIIWHRP